MTYVDPETGEILDHKGRRLTAAGSEIPDPTPIAPPVGYKKQPSMVEIVRDMVRSERLRQEAEAGGFGSFEEEDDFDVGDDLDPHSQWENEFEPEIPLSAGSPADESGEAAEPEPKAPRQAKKPKSQPQSEDED